MAVIKYIDENFELILISFLLAVMVLVSGMQVFFRYFINSSLAWSEEMSRYCYVWSGFLSLSFCIRRAADLRIEFVVSLLPPLALRGLRLLINAFCIGIYVIFLDSAITIIFKTAQIQQVSAALRIPMQVVYMAAVVGFALAIARTLQVGILDLIAIFRESAAHKTTLAPRREGEK